MKTKEQDAALAGFIALVAMMPLSMIMSGFVLLKLWRWFVTPAFSGVPQISLATAIGISLIVRYLTLHITPEEKGKSVGDLMYRAVGRMFLFPLFVLLIGYVVSLFM